MRRVIRTTSALQGLDEIWDYIAVEQSQPNAADRLIDEIDRAVQRLVHARVRSHDSGFRYSCRGRFANCDCMTMFRLPLNIA